MGLTGLTGIQMRWIVCCGINYHHIKKMKIVVLTCLLQWSPLPSSKHEIRTVIND